MSEQFFVCGYSATPYQLIDLLPFGSAFAMVDLNAFLSRNNKIENIILHVILEWNLNGGWMIPTAAQSIHLQNWPQLVFSVVVCVKKGLWWPVSVS